MTPKADAGSGKGRTSRKGMNDRLVTELHALQDDLRTMVERYEVRVGGLLNELLRRIEGDASVELRPKPATIRTAKEMLATIEQTKIKPRKARRKDLARLENLARTLTELSGSG